MPAVGAPLGGWRGRSWGIWAGSCPESPRGLTLGCPVGERDLGRGAVGKRVSGVEAGKEGGGLCASALMGSALSRAVIPLLL